MIKLTGNRETYKTMNDNLDLDASPVLYEPETTAALADRFLDLVIETANGRKTKAEALGFTEMAIARVCNFV